MNIFIHVKDSGSWDVSEMAITAGAATDGQNPVALSQPVNVTVPSGGSIADIHDEIKDTVRTALETEHGLTFSSSDRFILIGGAIEI